MKKLLDYLITSKTRIKLLLKFFLNAEARGYLRSLAEEFGESTNAVRVELNRLTEAGLLEAESEGRTKVYRANRGHALFEDLHNIVKKYIGIDQLIEEVLRKLGNVELALITGDYAKGIDSGIIDLVIVGGVDKGYLQVLVEKAEELIRRKIRILILNRQGFEKLKGKFEEENALVVWNQLK
ncbi:winged helix-turn-helix domain-containing protein [Aneurinibacillus thermoaerophilus]|uniref:PaaX-like protein n=1 Tax=Aneurinibacillus thermoaerophilus TaxID=143495 RepID=A0A1G7ZXV3_ANETH|nr:MULTISPECIES: winged helix-turn-helix domain-containing protein [Aneurinibacillus]MED0757679.1 winged helix-turn-helix domain-containing protein [Aneurinibacillus thermoaerophilus]MED0759318.1 winged helix-turn-helix domain-containing protein [Aneurinibacillus thermoaerophilus]SDH13441.1 PaaX-like protein [Aneurinibacillus thermoaerophilus]